jgi:predicted PurR-regulated permease PerM
VLRRWTDYRQRQRAALRESYRSRPYDESPERHEPNLITDTLPPIDGAAGIDEGPADAAAADKAAAEAAIDQDPAQGRAPEGATAIGHDGQPHRTGYGKAGRPLNRQSPFYVGFFGALGVLLAIGLWHMVGQLTQVITLLVVALFITLALNPIVEAMVRREIKRPLAVTTVFVGLVAVFVSLGLIVVPPVVQQGTLLAENAPTYLDGVLNNRLVRDLDTHYQVAEKLQTELQNRVTDGNFMSGIAGGVLGAGKAVLSGFFSFFTVLVLTLYFLSSLPRVKQAAYGMVPASRRPRVISLSEEIMRRVGSYAIGQVAVAAINATASWIMMTIVGIPYAAVLAVAVGFLGLLPMVGATLGAALVCTVAVFDEPRKAVIALVYYVIYQQIENYVIAPRIMQRTVSVPGAMTVVAALAGAALLGMLGALLAIPVAAGLLLLYEEVLVPRQRRT